MILSKEIDQHCSKEIDRHCSRKRGGKRKKIQGRRLDIPEAIDDNMPLSVDKASRVSIDRHLIVSIDAHHQRSVDSTSSTTIDCHFIVSIDTEQEPKLASNTKPNTTACLGAWYTWDRILQTSLEEVMILSFKSCESLLFSNFFQRDCPSVLLEDKQKELHRRVRCLAMDGDLPTVRLSPCFDARYRFTLAFQYHQFKVNRHPVAEVMYVLLKCGQSASQEKAVEEMKDCRSITQH
uniref:Uncharacterized protein n=1 Tax=Brassica oleracea var. oleracea TaxID=109376 RepID=A0A0D3BTQ4_BRAOL